MGCRRNNPGCVAISQSRTHRQTLNKSIFAKRRRAAVSLSIRLTTRNGLKTSSPASPTSPQNVNIYIGENFAVRLHQYFKLCQLVQNTSISGIIHTEFDPFRTPDHMTLSDHARKMRSLPNAGGSSVVSEVLSLEMLKRCFGANLIKTEMEVNYFPEGGSITDYTCCMFGTTLGVSVTRAMKFKGDFTEEDATKILNKKLNGILQSTRNSMDTWSKQILHVWAISSCVASIIAATFNQLISEEVKSNTVLLVTTTNANEIFFNK